MINNSAKDKILLTSYILCALTIGYLIFFLTPFLIGPWESYHIYNSFSEIHNPQIKMTIQVGANTAGHYGDNYGLINLWAYVFRKLHLTLTLFNIRILSIISGIISLLFYYRISVRWFGHHVALAITALLAVNETFLLFEHFLLPQMFTFAVILFCFERFLILYEDNEKYNLFANCMLGFAASLCAMNYLLSRLFLIFIFMLQIKMIFTDKNYFKISPHTIKDNFKKAYVTWISYLIFLGIFNIENISYTFKKVFIFSDLGEYSTGASSFLSNLLYNFPFLLRHTFLDIPFIKASLPFFILGDAKYHLLTLPFSCLLFFGILITLKNFKTFQNSLLISIFGMMLLIMNMSNIYEVFPDGSRNTTLSSFRTFYLLLPIFLLIGVFYKSLSLKLHEKFKNYHPVFDFYLIFLPLFILSINKNFKSMTTLKDFYDSHQFNFSIEAPRKKLSEIELSQNLNMTERLTEIQDGIYYKNQIYLRKLAEKIAEQINTTTTNANDKFYYYLPLEKYSPAYYDLCCSLISKPYLKTFLSIYLFDLGVKNTYIVNNPINYRFKNAKVIIATSESEIAQIKKDYPNIIEMSVSN